jgi:spore maturation protein CgeB
MRWLVGHPGPHFSVHDVYEGWVEGLRAAGEEVYTFNLGDRLTFYDAGFLEASDQDDDGRKYFRKAMPRHAAIETAADGIFRTLYKCWPHVVLLVSAFFTPPWMLDLIRGRGHKLVLLHTESPYQDDEQLIRAASAHINLLNDPTNLAAYREFGPAEYMPHAYRPSVHHPAAAGTAADYDLAFVGTGFPSRVKFFEEMNLTGLDVKLAGPWLGLPEDSPLRDWTATAIEGCVDNDDTAAIYRQARCGINFYRREGEDSYDGQAWACGPREIEMAACGLYFLRDPRPESDELFPMLPSFTSPAEASDLLRWALKHPEDRAEAAAKARAAIEDRTFENHARKLLAMLGN